MLVCHTDVRDCKDVQAKGIRIFSGVYDINVDVDGELQRLKVYCDMETDEGGWTVSNYIDTQRQHEHCIIVDATS